MSKSISARQLMCSVSAFIIASSLLTSNLYYFTGNDSWFSVIMGLAVSLAMVGIYSALSKRHPGMNLVEISCAVFGSVIGRVITLLYIFYFLSLTYFNTRDLGDFIKSSVLPNTPMMIILISFTIVCASAVKKGPVNITRYGFIAMFIAIMAIFINSLFLLNVTHLNYLLPSFERPVINYLIGAHIVTMLPFCEIMSFMMFIPSMQKPEEFGHAMRLGLCVGAGVLVFIVLRDITALGSYITIYTMPTFSAIRLIDIGDILTRLEIIYAVILISLLFYKVSVVYYATVSCIGSLFEIKSYRPLVCVIGTLAVIYAVACFPASKEHVEWNLTVAPTYSTFFLLVIPLLTLIVSWVRSALKNRQTMPRETV